MRRILIAVLAVSLLAGGGLYWSLHAGQEKTPPGPVAAAPINDLKLSGPYTHENLSIFLVHGPDTLQTKDFLTLAEALEQKKFVIYETQSVNELKMENVSDKPVIILSGDILKGGQQDRIAQNDQVVPPKSGKLALACFCVEHTASRWMKPLDKDNRTFHASPGQLASNGLRLANRAYGSQGDVWGNCSNLQKQLSFNLKTEVKAKESDSSLALSLDNRKVQEETEKYSQKLADLVKDKNDVIGYVFTINGKFVSADTYGSAQLFQKVWPRLLKANAIEAIAEMQKDKKFDAPTETTCRKFLSDTEKFTAEMARANQEQNRGRNGRGPDGRGPAAEEAKKAPAAPASTRNLLFESADQKHGVLRRNILAR